MLSLGMKKQISCEEFSQCNSMRLKNVNNSVTGQIRLANQIMLKIFSRHVKQVSQDK